MPSGPDADGTEDVVEGPCDEAPEDGLLPGGTCGIRDAVKFEMYLTTIIFQYRKSRIKFSANDEPHTTAAPHSIIFLFFFSDRYVISF